MTRWFLRLLLLVSAAALGAVAVHVDAAWWTLHVVVPACYLPPPRWILPAVRIGLAGAAMGLVIVAFRLRAPTWAASARVALAVVLALGASEMVLRLIDRPERNTPHPRLEWLMGDADARTGWSFVPGRQLQFAAPGGGPRITYAVDASGDRAPSTAFVEDLQAPTLLITGESIAVGHGLQWGVTWAARAGARLGLQTVNVAEGGYGSDQALLRARQALQRLAHPVALVSTVLPVQLHRNLDDSRPHLELRGGTLLEAPAWKPRILLRELIADDLQIMPEWRLARAMALTRAILEATAQAARERGARPFFVAPVFGEEPPLIEELLAGLPHKVVVVDRARIMPWDGHPDAEGSRAIADAVVQYVSSP